MTIAADFEIKKGNLLPELTGTLKDGTGAVVNLTGATVKFRMTPVGSTTRKVNDAAATIVTPTAGTVKYTWVGTDTDTVGNFYGVWLVTFADGKLESFYNDRGIYLRVNAEVP